VTILFKLLRKRVGRSMEPLHVSMTGVKMGERFLMIGTDDRALMAGLASKVGLSGLAAVAAFDDDGVGRAKAIGAKIGALIEAQVAVGATLPFESKAFDMVVIDDSRGRFAELSAADRSSYLRDAQRVVRPGGRIEVVEGLGGGIFGRVARADGYDIAADLAIAGFKPVRVLAERDGFRFVEGLRVIHG
jgi:SAM-dependent methyltransferase